MRKDAYKPVRNSRAKSKQKDLAMNQDLLYMRGDIYDKLTNSNANKHSGNELVESLLNIRSKLEDYLQMVAKDDHGSARHRDEP